VPTLLAPLAIWFEDVAWPTGQLIGGRVARSAWLVIVAMLCGWGFLRSYLSLLAMFGHRAVERTPGEAFAILRANWHDPQVIAPGYFLLHYFVVLVVPLAVICWLLVVASRWAKSGVRQAATEGKSPA